MAAGSNQGANGMQTGPATAREGTASQAAARLLLPDALAARLAADLSDADRALVERAHDFAARTYADKLLGTGEPAMAHALGLAGNIAALKLDADTIAAGLLFAIPTYTEQGQDKVAQDFGPAIAALVDGITRLNALRVVTRNAALDGGGGGGKSAAKAAAKTSIKGNSAGGSQVEVLRKMLLAMVEDIRVVLLRLASRTQTMRFLTRCADALRVPVARETLDIYAPLAHRLGMQDVKQQLEDLAFASLHPKRYAEIDQMVSVRAPEREQYLAKCEPACDARFRPCPDCAFGEVREDHHRSPLQGIAPSAQHAHQGGEQGQKL